MTSIFICVFLCVLAAETRGLIWVQPGSPEDNPVVYACVGNDVTLPWNYTSEGHEDISSIQWSYKSGSAEKQIAYFANDLLTVAAPYSGRFVHVTNGGIGLSHVTLGDTGSYAVEINVRGGVLATYRRSVLLQVADGLRTADGQLHARQAAEVRLDRDRQQWSVVLTCGDFTYFGPPAFPMEWETPSGEVIPVTDYTRGSFDLYLSLRTVEDGHYTCRVPPQHVPHACLHGNRTAEGQAKVVVSRLEVKMALMESEMKTLKRKVEDSVTPSVGFNALSRQDQQLTSPSRLQFHDVLYNQGAGYDNHTGQFTAPVTGTYLFGFHTRSLGDQLADAALMVGGRAVCLAYIFPGFQHGSCQAVARVLQGQQVWVEPYWRGSYGADTTSFSGVLLRRDQQE